MGSRNFLEMSWHLFDRRAYLRQDPRFPILLNPSPQLFHLGAIICCRGKVNCNTTCVANLSEIGELHGKTRAPLFAGEM